MTSGAAVVIVGGGVTGLSAGWWLARAGVDVLVLDKSIVGWEASGRNGGGATHVGSPFACAAALVVLDEVPGLLARVREAGARFEDDGWDGAGLLRVREGSADEARERSVLVIPSGTDGELVQATPPLVVSDAELDEAFERLR